MQPNRLDTVTYFEAFKEQNSLCYLPNIESSLMKKRGSEYISKLDEQTIPSISVQLLTTFPYQFDLPDLNEQQLCYYLIDKFAKSNTNSMTFATVPQWLGFDVDFPPDKPYLLLFLFCYFPNDELLTHLPSKANEITDAQLHASLKMLQRGLQLKSSGNLLPLPFSQQIRAKSAVYVFTKFKMVEFKARLATIKEAMKDPEIRSMVEQLTAQNQDIRQLLNG